MIIDVSSETPGVTDASLNIDLFSFFFCFFLFCLFVCYPPPPLFPGYSSRQANQGSYSISLRRSGIKENKIFIFKTMVILSWKI